MIGAAQTPLLAVVTVVRNDLPGLIRTHHTLRMQTCRRFEWLVIDGASTDGTGAWLEAHAGAETRWHSGPDLGLYDAMNRGLAAARAPFVLFLNAGDRLAEAGTIGRLTRSLTAESPDFLYADVLEEAPDGRVLLKPARSHRTAWYGLFTSHQAIIYRRAILAGLRFETDYRVGADYALTLQALARSRLIRRLGHPFSIVAPPGLSWREAARGRHDQRAIRTHALGYPTALCAAIGLLHWAAAEVRRRFPRLYEHLRFRPYR